MSIVDKLFRLDGEVAVVNGGAGRIGNRIAEAFVDAGAKTVIVDLDGDAARQQAERIASVTGGNCAGIQADSTDKASLESAAENVRRLYGPATILVNATQYRGSGFYGSDPADHPVEAFRQVLDVNLTGVLLACQVFGKQMIENRRGAIVNLSSTYGVVSADPRIYGDSGVNSPISYAASKSGVLNLTRYLAIHWRDKGIRVNCLVPGGVFDNQGEDFVKQYESRTPLGRMARADEYQGAALFMVSSASSYMTGAVVTVDGGWTAW